MKIIKILFLVSFSLNVFADCFFKNCVTCNDCEMLSENDCDFFGKTFFSPRPQDSNSVRRILGYFNEQNYFESDYVNKLNITIQYQKTFNSSDKLGKWFFFNKKNCMSVGIPGDGQSFDVDGSQFGLSLGLSSTSSLAPGSIGNVCISPEIENLIFDLDFHFDLCKMMCGLWTRVDIPIVQTKYDLKLTSSDCSCLRKSSDCGCAISQELTGNLFPAGLFSTDCTTTKSPYNSICEALKGDLGFGVIPPLECGKYPLKPLKKTGVAGIHFDVGYDFYDKDCAHLALSVHYVVPTGNRPMAKYVFEPIVGANKCWQVGAAIEAFCITETYDKKQIGLYLYAIGTHLYKAEQYRLFSLKNNGTGSQYLLLKNYDPNSITIESGERTANILCGKTKIGANFMFDGSVMIQLKGCDYFFDIGYNFWLRTKERKSEDTCLRNFLKDEYSVKGNQFFSNSDEFDCVPTCEYNTTTASKSTISHAAAEDVDSSGNSQPVFLTPNDINFTTPLHPGAMTHKFFAALGSNFAFANGCPGFALISGEVEFAGNGASLSQWGVILQAGINY